ncbi:MAG: DUF86 domain-containing protein [SAR324 cluster bacterium]|nr:DUF86 domain-containing protein [SAR324 cluster bacterium]
MLPEDRERLRHILDAAKEAMSFVANRTRADLDTDRMLTLALVKEIEIIGEAAHRMSEDARGENPQIPWPQIIGMRHRLVHLYFDIDQDVLWDTVAENLPPLIAALEKILPSGN